MDRYLLHVAAAGPGTPYGRTGTPSLTGHLYYVLEHSDGTRESYGFQPAPGRGPDGDIRGTVATSDADDYRDVRYTRTLEITRAQFETLQDFGQNPARYGFDASRYDAFSNSCVDFTWAALNAAGLHREIQRSGKEMDSLAASRGETLRGPDRAFEGDVKVLDNIDDLRSIRAPVPDSPLNGERWNPMPEQDAWQRLLSDIDTLPPAIRSIARQCSAGVERLDATLDRRPDASSAAMCVGLTELAVARGFPSVDDVVLGRRTDFVQAGQNVFIVRGDRTDPAAERAHLATTDAVSTSIDATLERLRALDAAAPMHAQAVQTQELSPAQATERAHVRSI